MIGMFNAEARANLGQFDHELNKNNARAILFDIAKRNLRLEGTPTKIGTMKAAFGDPRTGMPAKSSNGTCFVATAAFNSEEHETVRFLRQFRTDVLVSTSIGRACVTLYWKIGPQLARWLNAMPILKAPVRGILTALCKTIRVIRNQSSAHKNLGNSMASRRS